MINNIFLNKKIKKTVEILLLLFAIFLLYQILRKILGGSWSIEDIILGLLIFNIGCTFTVGIMLAELRSDHNHLRDQFKNLAKDFKGRNKIYKLSARWKS